MSISKKKAEKNWSYYIFKLDIQRNYGFQKYTKIISDYSGRILIL